MARVTQEDLERLTKQVNRNDSSVHERIDTYAMNLQQLTKYTEELRKSVDARETASVRAIAFAEASLIRRSQGDYTTAYTVQDVVNDAAVIESYIAQGFPSPDLRKQIEEVVKRAVKDQPTAEPDPTFAEDDADELPNADYADAVVRGPEAADGAYRVRYADTPGGQADKATLKAEAEDKLASLKQQSEATQPEHEDEPVWDDKQDAMVDPNTGRPVDLG